MTVRSLCTLAMTLVLAAVAHAQADLKPTNSLPNPYGTVKDWAKMPVGRTWGSTSAIEIDRDGKSIWVAERCGANSCADSMLDPVLHFDQTGKLIKSFGAGLMIAPHGISFFEEPITQNDALLMAQLRRRTGMRLA